jgi:hypothetical protein
MLINEPNFLIKNAKTQARRLSRYTNIPLQKSQNILANTLYGCNDFIELLSKIKQKDLKHKAFRALKVTPHSEAAEIAFLTEFLAENSKKLANELKLKDSSHEFLQLLYSLYGLNDRPKLCSTLDGFEGVEWRPYTEEGEDLFTVIYTDLAVNYEVYRFLGIRVFSPKDVKILNRIEQEAVADIIHYYQRNFHIILDQPELCSLTLKQYAKQKVRGLESNFDISPLICNQKDSPLNIILGEISTMLQLDAATPDSALPILYKFKGAHYVIFGYPVKTTKAHETQEFYLCNFDLKIESKCDFVSAIMVNDSPIAVEDVYLDLDDFGSPCFDHILSYRKILCELKDAHKDALKQEVSQRLLFFRTIAESELNAYLKNG